MDFLKVVFKWLLFFRSCTVSLFLLNSITWAVFICPIHHHLIQLYMGKVILLKLTKWNETRQLTKLNKYKINGYDWTSYCYHMSYLWSLSYVVATCSRTFWCCTKILTLDGWPVCLQVYSQVRKFVCKHYVRIDVISTLVLTQTRSF